MAMEGRDEEGKSIAAKHMGKEGGKVRMAMEGRDEEGKSIAAKHMGKEGGKVRMAMLGLDRDGRFKVAVEMNMQRHYDRDRLTWLEGSLRQAIIDDAYDSMDVKESMSKQATVLVMALISSLPDAYRVNSIKIHAKQNCDYSVRLSSGRNISFKINPDNNEAKTVAKLATRAILTVLEEPLIKNFFSSHRDEGWDTRMLMAVLTRVMKGDMSPVITNLYECPVCPGDKCQRFYEKGVGSKQIRCCKGEANVKGYNNVKGCYKLSNQNDWKAVKPDWKNVGKSSETEGKTIR